MDAPTDSEREELELMVSDVLYEVANFAWVDLADRIPVRGIDVRPEDKGGYMAVTWEADWKRQRGGPIFIRVQGFLDRDHKTPIWWSGETICKRGWLHRLLNRNSR